MVPIQPAPPPAEITLRPQPQQRRLEQDERWFTLGVGPLLLGNFHWLDQPKDRSVSVGSVRGTDERYPGFVGADLTVGVMLDVRFWHFVGVEFDVFRQNDRGTGTITVKYAGDLCFLPGIAKAYPAERFRVTIGQAAWHVPLLLKLTLPGEKVVVHNEDVDREIRKWFTTFAFGPEMVFPSDATLRVEPSDGLGYPTHARASSYVMYTGALGLERRLSDAHDIRLLVSWRGSYNPSAGRSAMQRGDYAIAAGKIEPLAYKSEWRYQAALTLGVGWYF